MSRDARPAFAVPREDRSSGRDLDKLLDRRREPANDAEDGEEPAGRRGALDVDRARERIAATRRKDFSKLPEDTGRRGGGESNRGPMILILAAVVLAVFGVAVWNAYRDGVRVEGADAGTPELAGGPFKKRPDAAASSPAAVEASVYGAMERSPDLAGSPSPKQETVELDPRVEGIIEPKPEPKPQPSVVAKVTPTPAPKPEPKPEAKPSVATAAAAPAAKVEPAPPVGRFAVQIGALSSPTAADAEWAKRVKAQPELFAGAVRDVQKAEVNGKTVYRLRATGFAKATDAEAFCSSYKLLGGACYRVAN